MDNVQKLHPDSRLSIHEQNEMFQNFGGFYFERFLAANQIEIQSMRTLRNGSEVANSPRRLADVWDRHLRRLIDQADVNLGQMLRNYHEKSTTMHQKREIYFKIKSLGLVGIDRSSELEFEALMLGIAMMLSDTLEINLSNIHAFEF
jgi:hypothetical protein